MGGANAARSPFPKSGRYWWSIISAVLGDDKVKVGD